MSAENKTVMNITEDLMIMSPMRQPCSILKPSQKDNLILLQTPVHKNLKVSFITPQSTPLPSNSKVPNFQFSSQPFHGSMSSVSSFVDFNVSSNPPKSPNVLDQSASSEKNWEVLRQLDEDLKWKDRVEIITKLDHEDYTNYAAELIGEMIFNAVDISECPKVSGDEYIPLEGDHACSSVGQPSVNISEQATRAQSISSMVNDSLDSLVNNLGFLNLNASTDTSANLNTILPGSQGDSDLTKPHTSLSNSLPENATSHVDLKSRPHLAKRLYSTELANIPEDCDPFDALQNQADQNMKNASGQNPIESGIEGITNAMAGLQMPKNHAFARPNTSSRVSNNSDPKTPNFSHIDASFSGISPASNVNLENEVFVDGAQMLQQGQLDLDYLEQKTSGDVSNTLRKQSLYMKFDPLLENISPRKSLAMIGRKSDIIDFNERATPLPNDLEDLNTPSPREPDLLCDSPSQLSIITNMSNSTFFNMNESRSGSASTSASSTISVSGGMKSDFGIVEVLKYTDADVDRILRRKKVKWAKDKEMAVKEYTRIKKELGTMIVMLEGYEDLVEEKSRERPEETKSQEKKTTKEEYQSDSKMVSKTTTAVLQQYEQMQRVHANLTSNHVSLTENIKKVKTRLDETNNNIAELKRKTDEEEVIVQAAIKKCNSQTTSLLSALNSKVKSLEVKVKSLQATLIRKKNENEELVKICDELVTNAEEGT